MLKCSTIWKFPFAITDDVRLAMPQGAKVVHVECQDGQPCMWAIVDPRSASVVRRFRIYGTGHPVDSRADEHVATFQDGPFVWHVFEAPA